MFSMRPDFQDVDNDDSTIAVNNVSLIYKPPKKRKTKHTTVSVYQYDITYMLIITS